MPDVTFELEVNASSDRVWGFVSDMDNLASLIPGYINHEVVSDGKAPSTIECNVAVLNKLIAFKMRVTEWLEPSKIAFSMDCRDERVTGNGYVEIRPVGSGTTMVKGFMELRLGGVLGPMFDAFMKPQIPRIGRQLAEELANKLEVSVKAREC